MPVDGYGWVAIDGTPPEDKLPDPLKQPRSKTENPEPQPPPPTTVPPPTSIPDELDPDQPEEEDEDEASGAAPGLARRPRGRGGRPGRAPRHPARRHRGAQARPARQRRRTRGPPSQRVAGSFDELDRLHPGPRAVPCRRGRPGRSCRCSSGRPGASALATRADDAVFGPDDPTDVEIDAAWDELATTRFSLVAEMDRWGRLPDRGEPHVPAPTG